jgi:hypothetical protein
MIRRTNDNHSNHRRVDCGGYFGMGGDWQLQEQAWWMMKILDLFAGKGGELRRSKIESMGHEYTTLDVDPAFGCTITADIMTIDDLGLYDLIWASVPCETWSVASIGCHWQGGKQAYIPKSENAKYMIDLVQHTIKLLNECSKTAWVMENPRGILRKMPFMQDFTRQTVTYCQYGENRMKPTDIWTVGLNWKARPICHNGDSCHVAAPRGSRTGTQGMGSYADKSIVPFELWREILESIKKDNDVPAPTSADDAARYYGQADAV